VNQRNSSISSSRLGLGSGWNYWPLIVIAGWAILGLIAIDVAINIAFAFPSDPKVLTPSSLQQYFEYGRSAEGALIRMTRPSRLETAPITLAGWYDPLVSTGPATRSTSTSEDPNPHKPVVTIFGGSHSVRLANALGRVSKDLTWRSVGAPGATPNWSYGAYLRDRGGGNSIAVVLTFNANELAMITSFSPAIWSGDLPMPYVGDRFYLKGGQLKAILAPYDSFEQYEQRFFNPKAWSETVDFFAKNDPLYDSFAFRASLLDRSSLVRLARRAYNQNRNRSVLRAVLDKSGFNPASEAIQVARAIIRAFAAQARADGMIPVIYLVNSLGYSDNLFRALKPALDADKVPYVSSHEFVSPNDPNGYLPDSHFTDANDDLLAAALEDVVKRSR
jgi:hypothetical protein